MMGSGGESLLRTNHRAFARRHDKFRVWIFRQNTFENASPVISAVAHE